MKQSVSKALLVSSPLPVEVCELELITGISVSQLIPVELLLL